MRTKSWKMRFTVVACALMAAAALYQMQIAMPPPVMASTSMAGTVDPAAIVAVVQSEQEHAADIEYAEIRALIREAVELAGGFSDLISDGDTVVLKPNLMTVNSRTLPQEVNGITTDWRVTQAVVELVREVNVNGHVIILEGVANGTTKGNMQTLGYVPEQIQGVDDFIHLEDRSGGWREYDSPLLAEVTLPEGMGLYPDNLKVNKSPEFYLNRLYYEADVVISLPVLKNHSISGVTGAVKNVGIGATPTNIYGAFPGQNMRMTNQVINHGRVRLHQWIHDYYLCRPVDFAIMDGLQGLLNGPVGQGSGELSDAQQNMRLILASRDAVALDTIAALLMQYDPSRVSHLAHLHNSGAGCLDTSGIRVEGIEPSTVRQRFTNRYGGATFYADMTNPDVTLNSCIVDGDTLVLSLATDEDTVKAEIWLDEQRLDAIVVSEFDDIRLPLPALEPGTYAVIIRVYDRFLNYTTQEAAVTW
ncbi:DUF362 domain-containing protein [Candidatus Bipolaricaulota bacterium]